METQFGAKQIPKQLDIGQMREARSFSEVLEFLEANEEEYQALGINGPLEFAEHQERDLKRLSKAFRLNRKIQKLYFNNLKIDHILVAEAFGAGFGKDKVTCLEFWSSREAISQRLVETMCQGFQERSTTFELKFYDCSSEFACSIIEASYLKCFSLEILSMDFLGNQTPLKHMFSRGTLYYISLAGVKGLKGNVFMDLARCVLMLPKLTTLSLNETAVPSSAMKCLHGSLKMILNSERRSNVFELLSFGNIEVEEKLNFAYFRLLRSDLICNFSLKVKDDCSRAVLKDISATAATTKKLELLWTWSAFSSGTKFANFCVQAESNMFQSPFQVNPMVASDY